MDDLDEFLEASTGDGETFAGSVQECFDAINRIHPKDLPMFERWHNRKPQEVWDDAFTADYTSYMNAWFRFRIDIMNNGGNFGSRERYQLKRLIAYFEDIGSFWAGG